MTKKSAQAQVKKELAEDWLNINQSVKQQPVKVAKKASTAFDLEKAIKDANQVIRIGYTEKFPEANLIRVGLKWLLKHTQKYRIGDTVYKTNSSLTDYGRACLQALHDELKNSPEKGGVVAFKVQFFRYGDLPEEDRLEESYAIPIEEMPSEEELLKMG